jgi:hypothetical protein
MTFTVVVQETALRALARIRATRRWRGEAAGSTAFTCLASGSFTR